MRCFQVQSVQVCLDNCKVRCFSFQSSAVISLFKYYKVREAFRVHKVSDEFKVLHFRKKKFLVSGFTVSPSVSWWLSIQFDSI